MPEAPKKHRKIRRVVIRAIFVVATFIITIPIVAIGLYLLAVLLLPYHARDEAFAAPSTTVFDRQKQVIAECTASDGQWRKPVSADQVSLHLKQALVAVEDSRFYSHHGVDCFSLCGAVIERFIHPSSTHRGASTITMQLARLRHPASRTLLTKIDEAIVAGQIEHRMSKEQILLEYINCAPFGGNLEGAEAASEKYFGRTCKDLSLGQAALLAGIPQSPRRLRPDRFPQEARARREHVLDRMLACKFITQIERDQAAAEPIDAKWRSTPQARGNAHGLLPTLVAHRHIPGDWCTTIDAATQKQTCDALQAQLNELNPSGINAAAAIVLDTRTSEVLASVSLSASRHRAGDFTRAMRSSGSTLKPFIYAAAFDAGILGPKTRVDDSPTAWPGYQPNDFDRAFRGELSAAEALAESRNIPAMLVLERVGLSPAAGVMAAGGITHLWSYPERYGLTLAVGGVEVSPWELASAYAMLGRGGVAKWPRMEMKDDAGNVPKQVLSARASWQILGALSNPDRTRGVAPEAARTQVAWKTGTSSGRRDAWCAAVSRSRTIVVWFGNIHDEGSASLVGQDAAAPVALHLMAVLAPLADPWPSIADNGPKALARRSDSASLVIKSPAPNAEIVLSSDLPRNRQRVLLDASARGSESTPELWWFVDGQPVTRKATSSPVWWNASAGAHVIRVTDLELHSASTHITVR